MHANSMFDGDAVDDLTQLALAEDWRPHRARRMAVASAAGASHARTADGALSTHPPRTQAANA
jgi:hypothetical protein